MKKPIHFNRSILQFLHEEFFVIKFRRTNYSNQEMQPLIMRNLNISGGRLVTMDEVDEMIRAVDDGDGLLDYGEFVNLIQKH